MYVFSSVYIFANLTKFTISCNYASICYYNIYFHGVHILHNLKKREICENIYIYIYIHCKNHKCLRSQCSSGNVHK